MNVRIFDEIVKDPSAKPQIVSERDVEACLAKSAYLSSAKSVCPRGTG